MFQGFNKSTIKYFEAIRRENSKSNYKAHERYYFEGIKEPLEELYHELFHYFGDVDSRLLSSKRRCISSAYNDARFCREEPIKEYFYIRFKLDKGDKKSAPGFFLDASLEGYRYGMSIYKPEPKGMEKIREYFLDNKYSAIDAVQKFTNAGLLELQGDLYKRDNYPEADPVIKPLLERKRLAFVKESVLEETFFSRKLLDNMTAAYDSVIDIYSMMEEAL